MEYRTLEITVISAKNIKNVNHFSKMDVYAVVTIAGDPRSKQRTPIDKDGGTNPSWNFSMKFTIDEAAAQQNRLALVFQIRSERSFGDKEIGEVNVHVKELLDTIGNSNSNQFVSYQVRKTSGKSQGELNFSYKFGEKVTNPNPNPAPAEKPITAYPAPVGTSVPYHSSGAYPPAAAAYPPSGGYGYPPPVGGHGYPPNGGYGAPGPGYGYPMQAGYGYPQMQQQKPRKNKMGMGLGAGLLGGALGGLLVGDMVSDAASYDGGYDGGFDGGGGFDF